MFPGENTAPKDWAGNVQLILEQRLFQRVRCFLACWSDRESEVTLQQSKHQKKKEIVIAIDCSTTNCQNPLEHGDTKTKNRIETKNGKKNKLLF